jgi:DNA polymerase V
MYQMTAKELGRTIMQDILTNIGIPAACGIGNNLYLAKIALDITAKHAEDRIGILDEEIYRRTLWQHRPITDFWRVGAGIARKLESMGITTMEGIARANEDALYHAFGIDAELLIDHAWGREPTTIADIHAYKPRSNSIGSGQVLGCDCDYEGGRLIVKEMADMLSLELVDKGLVTDSLTLHVGYNKYVGKSPAHGTIGMTVTTSSARQIMAYAEQLYERIVDPTAPIHRFNLTCNNVIDEAYQQYDLFCDPEKLEKEHRLQKAMLEIKGKFGKNAILKGMNLQEGATAMERNRQIGGHKSGE